MKILYHLIYSCEKDIIDDSVHPIMNSKHDVTIKLDLICSDLEHYEKCKTLTDQYQQNTIFQLFRENNQSARHNDALILGYELDNYDAVIFSEPGIHFETSEDFDYFIEKAEPLFDSKYIIAGRTCDRDNVFAAFQLVTRLGWNHIGCWDENLFYSTNENDWFMRAFKHCGNTLDWLELITTNSFHIGKWFHPEGAEVSSWRKQKRSVIHPMAELYQNPGVRASVDNANWRKGLYLIKKWNSLFDTVNAWHDPAVFNTPFNDSSIGFKIHPVNRVYPYPVEYNRTDRATAYFRFFDKEHKK